MNSVGGFRLRGMIGIAWLQGFSFGFFSLFFFCRTRHVRYLIAIWCMFFIVFKNNLNGRHGCVQPFKSFKVVVIDGYFDCECYGF